MCTAHARAGVNSIKTTHENFAIFARNGTADRRHCWGSGINPCADTNQSYHGGADVKLRLMFFGFCVAVFMAVSARADMVRVDCVRATMRIDTVTPILPADYKGIEVVTSLLGPLGAVMETKSYTMPDCGSSIDVTKPGLYSLVAHTLATQTVDGVMINQKSIASNKAEFVIKVKPSDPAAPTNTRVTTAPTANDSTPGM